ncbi:unnamed protein product [Choristocarpus tenellus]
MQSTCNVASFFLNVTYYYYYYCVAKSGATYFSHTSFFLVTPPKSTYKTRNGATASVCSGRLSCVLSHISSCVISWIRPMTEAEFQVLLPSSLLPLVALHAIFFFPIFFSDWSCW